MFFTSIFVRPIPCLKEQKPSSIEEMRTTPNLLMTSWKILLTPSKVVISQPATTCSKLTIEILKQGVKYVQS